MRYASAKLSVLFPTCHRRRKSASCRKCHNQACFPRRFRAAADLGRVEQETTEKTEIRTSLRFLRLLLFQSDGPSAVGQNLWGSPRSGVQCAKNVFGGFSPRHSTSDQNAQAARRLSAQSRRGKAG